MRKKRVNTRAFPRLKAHHLLRYRLRDDEASQFVTASVKNISGGGILFKTDQQMSVGAELELEINFPSFEKPLQVLASVVRVRQSEAGDFEIGAHFTSIEELQRSDLVKKIDFMLNKLKEKKSFWIQLRKSIKRIAPGKYAFLILVFITLSVLYAGNTCAAIDIGSCKLHPSIVVKQSFEDNYFLSETEKKDEFITIVTPELYLEALGGEDLLGIGYKVDLTSYAYQTHDIVDKHEIYTKLQLKGAKFYLEAEEAFKEIREVTSYGDSLNEHNKNDFYVIFGADFNRLGYEAQWENIDYDHAETHSSDYNKDLLTFTGTYRVFPKTKALVEYTYKKVRYDVASSVDNNSNAYKIGVTGELTPKISGTIKTGHEKGKYKSQKDWEGGIFGVDLEYALSSSTLLALAMERTTKESRYTTENYYETNDFSLDVSQKITSKTDADFGISYKRDEYPEPSSGAEAREDDLWTFDVGLTWMIRPWLESVIAHTYKSRASNANNADYRANISSITLTAGF